MVWNKKYSCWIKVYKNYISHKKEVGNRTLLEGQK